MVRGCVIAAALGGVVGATAAAAEPRAGDVRAHVLKATNAYRARHDAPALKSHEALRAAAQGYADYLVSRPEKYESWGHASDGRSPGKRMRSEGYGGCGGENLYSGWTTGELGELGRMAMKGWIASKGHEANLRRAAYAEIGIGMATRKWNGRTFFVVVQNFGDGADAERCVAAAAQGQDQRPSGRRVSVTRHSNARSGAGLAAGIGTGRVRAIPARACAPGIDQETATQGEQ